MHEEPLEWTFSEASSIRYDIECHSTGHAQVFTRVLRVQVTSLLQEYFFQRVFLFSMTDEVVSLSFPKMAWYLMAICVKQ